MKPAEKKLARFYPNWTAQKVADTVASVEASGLIVLDVDEAADVASAAKRAGWKELGQNALVVDIDDPRLRSVLEEVLQNRVIKPVWSGYGSPAQDAVNAILKALKVLALNETDPK